MRCGTIRLSIINRVYLLSGGSLRRMVLLLKWSVIVVFSWLVFYCVVLVRCVCLLVCALFLSLLL